jgi:hypothetical protein
VPGHRAYPWPDDDNGDMAKVVPTVFNENDFAGSRPKVVQGNA